jgi:hypothetical protein
MMEDLTAQHGKQPTPEMDIVKTRTFDSHEQAEQLYLSALQRLLNVNGWNALTGSDSDQYQLLSSLATPKEGNAQEGDFIKIKAGDAGNGETEVLRVERVITKLLDHNRSVSLLTRPVRITRLSDRIEYVVGHKTDYTFVVQLQEVVVSSGIYVKDESPVEDQGIYNKITHSLKALFAWTPLYKTKWHALMEGILK